MLGRSSLCVYSGKSLLGLWTPTQCSYPPSLGLQIIINAPFLSRFEYILIPLLVSREDFLEMRSTRIRASCKGTIRPTHAGDIRWISFCEMSSGAERFGGKGVRSNGASVFMLVRPLD
ncbi:hypothetical protein L211DRAFT_833151 [Terfezia boudieri ATCC MYA-4762]|uniref:Uncharacterized protein n=1 Tax=Terfezia boudieri ATCC MYA-4762 TaxID=1051890 RepID=A0A3N4LZ33_9PEZI|nr:hypothetical protein L211DRAFT_833151 [Terfezia boudieri ATCC MYA-4762]